MTGKRLPPWDAVLSAAARLQKLVPGAVVVGGTAAALHAHHRFSQDADHTVGDLRTKFDQVLAELESVAGWKTARIKRPVMILGSLDGIATGVRQLIRDQPLETMQLKIAADSEETVTFPTAREMLRIKAALILKRNATRDYLDTAALCKHMGCAEASAAFDGFDELYPQPGGASATQQLIVQLTSPKPYDLDETDLSQYKGLSPGWTNFKAVENTLAMLGIEILDRQGPAPGTIIASKQDEREKLPSGPRTPQPKGDREDDQDRKPQSFLRKALRPPSRRAPRGRGPAD